MTKVKSITKSAPSTPKGNLKSVKDPVIGKNKTPKFKNTPTGKVALINGSTPKSDRKKNSPKGKGNSPQTTPQNGKRQSLQNKQNSNGKQNSPKNKKNLAVQAQQKSPGDKKNIKKSDLSLENENDFDEDINEGISIKEEVSGIEDHSDSDEEDSDEDEPGLTDILGDSLANESDEDDDDFEDDDDEDEDEDTLETKNKGVKMFKGLKTEQITEKSENDEDEEENDDDEDEDADEEEEEEAGPGLKALLGNSLADDDDDDDFDEGDEEDEDEDISDEDEEEEGSESPAKKQKQSAASIIKKEEEDSIDDDDNDEDEDEDDENEDDDNVNEDADAPQLTKADIEERNKRTIYIGNVPIDVTEKEIKKLFSKYGSIETIRVRGVVPENPKMSSKAAFIKKKIHPKVSTAYMFILYKSEECAQKALEMNGKQLNGNYLRVDLCRAFEERSYDTKKAVFIGNLPFDTNDNMIWTHFADCGKISSVRVVKDNKTGVGRGFGYINFDSTDSVTLALKLDGSKLGNREIRVKLIDNKAAKKNWQNNAGKRQYQGKRQYGGSPKKFKNDPGDSNQSSPNYQRKVEKKRSQGEQQRQNTEGGSPRGKGGASFQGQRSDMKKKSTSGKFEKKKKIMAAKLTSKPKKPMAN